MKNLNNLINNITPLYHKYKQEKKTLSGTDALYVMWDIGELLRQFIKTHNIKPHTLYREIYGKSEGLKNITQRSYIPREFQGRCFRIRRIFNSKETIAKELPHLKKFTCFREAMPFFDNPKYKLDGTARTNLLKLLNSNMDTRDLLKEIESLQEEHIGIKNPRNQKLHQMESERKLFIEFYNYIYELIQLGTYDKIGAKIAHINTGFISMLAKNTSALSADGLKFFEFEIPKSAMPIWRDYANVIKMFISQKTPQGKRRFRRLISPARMSRLADMLYALLSEEKYNRFKC